MSFRDRDMGYARILRELGSLEEPAVFVGLRGKDTDSELLTYAAANELGTDTIPERSFLRSTADKNQAEYLDALEDVAGVIVDKGREAGKDALGRLGLRAVRDVQRAIVDLKDPPNAPSTIAAKGSSNPLVDTGRMRQSIDFVVVDGDGEV